MKSLLINVSNVETRDVPKYIACEDISKMTPMTKSTDRRISDLVYSWDEAAQKIVKNWENTSMVTGKMSKQSTSFKVVGVPDHKMPSKEIYRRIRANIRDGFTFTNIKVAEVMYTAKNSRFKNILEYTTSDFDINKSNEGSPVHYTFPGIDPQNEIYREMPIVHDIYDSVCGFMINRVFMVFDLVQKIDSGVRCYYSQRYLDLLDIEDSRWTVLEMKKTQGMIPKNLEDISMFDALNLGEICSGIIIGPCVGGDLDYYYMYHTMSIIPKVTLCGNARGGAIRSGNTCYVGFMHRGIERRVKTKIKSIVSNYDTVVGLNALVYYTKEHENTYFIQNVDSYNTNKIAHPGDLSTSTSQHE